MRGELRKDLLVQLRLIEPGRTIQTWSAPGLAERARRQVVALTSTWPLPHRSPLPSPGSSARDVNMGHSVACAEDELTRIISRCISYRRISSLVGGSLRKCFSHERHCVGMSTISNSSCTWGSGRASEGRQGRLSQLENNMMAVETHTIMDAKTATGLTICFEWYSTSRRVSSSFWLGSSSFIS